jgi:hypothetical protein
MVTTPFLTSLMLLTLLVLENGTEEAMMRRRLALVSLMLAFV